MAAIVLVGLTRYYGYEVETFVDPNLALQNFKACTYDLLLLDVRVRGSDGFGFELYNKLRKIDEKIQLCFVAASNTSYEKYKRLYPEIQEEYYIQKPGLKSWQVL